MRIRKRPVAITKASQAPAPASAATLPASTPHDPAPACLILQTPYAPFQHDFGACRRKHQGISNRLRVDHEHLSRGQDDDVGGLIYKSSLEKRHLSASAPAGHTAEESCRRPARTIAAPGQHLPTNGESAPSSGAIGSVPSRLARKSRAGGDDNDDHTVRDWESRSCTANNSILQGQAEDGSKMLQQGEVHVKSMQWDQDRRSSGAQIACEIVSIAAREEVQKVIDVNWRSTRPQVDMSTTSGAARHPEKNQISISPTFKWDHAMQPVQVPCHEDSARAFPRSAGGEAGGDWLELGSMLSESGRGYIKSSSCKWGNDIKMEMWPLEVGVEENVRSDYMGGTNIVCNEEEIKEDGGGGDEEEQQRCGRKSGRGWQCKNVRALGGQTIYCDYHRLKIFQHHATWNARNKLVKKKKKKKRNTSTETGHSQELHCNMVDINVPESSKAVHYHYLDNNMQTGALISSEDVDHIFERVLQAARRVRKQPMPIMRCQPRCTASTTLLPNLIETFVPFTPQAHPQEESGSQAGSGSGLKLWRFKNIIASCEVEGPEYNSLMVVDGDNGATSKMSITNHDGDGDDENDATGTMGITHDGDEGGEEERCRRVDGRGWRCKNMRAKDGRNSMFCEHHRAKLREHYEKRSLIRSRESRRGRRRDNPCGGGAAALAGGTVVSNVTSVRREGGDNTNSESEEGDAADDEQRCARMDGRGWQCKHVRVKGSMYCGHHRAKLRENHATWKARSKLQLPKSKKSWDSRRAAPQREGANEFHELVALDGSLHDLHFQAHVASGLGS